MRISRIFGPDWLRASVAAWIWDQTSRGRCDAGARDQLHTPSGSGYQTFVLVEHHSVDVGTVIIFSKDVGHHTSGWFRNPDYERCYHLSLSFRETISGESIPFEEKVAAQWLGLMFGRWLTHIWIENAQTPGGRSADVRHYRVFCDDHWQPITPRGEVYSNELTEAGWKSFSELAAENQKQ